MQITTYIIIAVVCSLVYYATYRPTKEYDFIIVGGGTAGCVLEASRLSENPNVTVLLIEAGGNFTNHPFVVDSSLHVNQHYTSLVYTLFPSNVPNYKRSTKPLYLRIGKMLGGSSASNAMAYTRGHIEDWNKLSKLVNDEEWNFDNVLPFFKKSEDNDMGDSKYHATGGPLHVSSSERYPFLETWKEVAKEMGIEWTDDYNAEKQNGFGVEQRTIKKGKRVSSLNFLSPSVISRPNLEILVDRTVMDVIIDKDKKAIGVRVMTDQNSIADYRASKEVILSAGAIFSPTILMRSGIGDPEVLRKAKIHPKVHSPFVGNNLLDHSLITLTYNFSVPKDDFVTGSAWIPFSKNVPCDIILVLKQIQKIENHAIVALWIINTANSEKGNVTIESKSLLDDPKIEYPYHPKHPNLYKAIEFVRKIMKTKAMQKYSPIEILPGNEPLDSFLEDRLDSVNHLMGTCAMGKVVDSKLNVIGVKNLRVVDASVIPFLFHVGPYVNTIMIAEKASNFIKEKYNL